MPDTRRPDPAPTPPDLVFIEARFRSLVARLRAEDTARRVAARARAARRAALRPRG